MSNFQERKMAEEKLKPFHESIIPVLNNAMMFALPALANLLSTTIIPDNHDAIAEAARRRLNATGGFGDKLAEKILAQKKTSKKRKRKKDQK